MNFDQRLQRAIERGQRTGDVRLQEQSEQALSTTDLRNLHSGHRLQLSEHIENCLKTLAGHFPGFRYAPVLNEDGWGATIARDDLVASHRGRPQNFYSRLEMLIRPFTPGHLIDLQAKGTVRNKEVLHRNHFQRIVEVDLDSFKELIDLWVLEYAEKYAAHK